ncbi:PREDICTED: uncharacterized protein LOC109590507, partial [Amphimedon queenslandica]|uniref:Tudor domain-containing protein n=2 Tax=Amphimedon queenslandica TaxID=400682 RepID=A0AAN0JXY9_AMPQE
MVLTALRKVTFHCEANQAAFITMGGSSLVVKLCKYDQNKYPPETTERLRELVVDKLLIAAVLPVNKDEKKITSSIFPVLSHFEAIDYPLYYVDIANEDKTWVTDILVKEGLGVAASPNRSFLDSENLSWIVARGTHVSGSNSLWLNFSVDKKPDNVKEMVDSLLKLPHPSSMESPPIPLPLSFGVYAVWSEGVWYRGWLLNDDSKEKRSDHTFLCLDYGFEVSVPLNHVMVLPDSCRGIAPQAAPCILLGMDSPPKSYTILRHTAAILGNIAFEKELYRREIKVTGGVTLLLE